MKKVIKSAAPRKRTVKQNVCTACNGKGLTPERKLCGVCNGSPLSVGKK